MFIIKLCAFLSDEQGAWIGIIPWYQIFAQLCLTRGNALVTFWVFSSYQLTLRNLWKVFEISFLSVRKILLVLVVKDSCRQEFWSEVVQNHCKLRFFCFSINNSDDSMGYVSKRTKMSCSTLQNARNLIQIYQGQILKKGIDFFVFSYTGLEKKTNKTKQQKRGRPEAKFDFGCHENVSSCN